VYIVRSPASYVNEAPRRGRGSEGARKEAPSERSLRGRPHRAVYIAVPGLGSIGALALGRRVRVLALGRRQRRTQLRAELAADAGLTD
jgi:hypothetical protein